MSPNCYGHGGDDADGYDWHADGDGMIMMMLMPTMMRVDVAYDDVGAEYDSADGDADDGEG